MDAMRRLARSAIGSSSPEPVGSHQQELPPPASTGASGPPAQSRDRAPFVLLLLATLLVLWVARGVLGPFIVAAVVAYAFSPLVSAGIRRTGWPRVAVVGVGYVIAAAIIAIVVALLAGRIVHEVQLLASGGPDALAATLRQLLGSDRIEIGGQTILVADIATEIQTRALSLFAEPGDAIHVAASVGEVGLELILMVIVTFYFLVDGEAMMDKVVALLPFEHRARTVSVLGRIHEILGKWLRGQILLIALVAAVAYIGLGPVLHLPYALLLALMTGVLEVIPLVGPIVATGIVAIDAFARGGASVALAVIVFYFVLRQVEDQIVMPVVIGRAVHLHPVVTIFAVLVGLSLYGVLGGLLGVPIAAAANVVFRELYPTEPPPATAPAPPSEATS